MKACEEESGSQQFITLVNPTKDEWDTFSMHLPHSCFQVNEWHSKHDKS